MWSIRGAIDAAPTANSMMAVSDGAPSLVSVKPARRVVLASGVSSLKKARLPAGALIVALGGSPGSDHTRSPMSATPSFSASGNVSPPAAL